MKIGFGAPVAGAWAGPETLARFGVRAEQLGYHSLWTFHRLLIPEDPATIPPVYHSVFDPLVALTYAAAHTHRIRLGVATLNLPFVSPTYLAKQAATLDVLSGGRLDLGLGTGWQQQEFIATGSTSHRRAARTAEFLQVLNTLWADEISEFTGDFYTVPRTRMAPKPVQHPGPPVLLGGTVPAALTRAGRLTDGWIMSWNHRDLDRLDEQIALVKTGAQAAGKDPDDVRIICRGIVNVTTDPVPDRPPLTGTPTQIRADAEELATHGVTELFYELNHNPNFGSPAADTQTAVEQAEEILEALAPGN